MTTDPDLLRREFLALTANRTLGLTLAGSAAGWFGPAAADASAPATAATADHVIYLYLAGGLSHLESFDPKPDASAHARGQAGAIATKVDGIQLGALLKKTASQADKIALIRSMSSTQGAHEQGNYFAHTAYPQRSGLTHPGVGAWVSKLDPPDRAHPNLPSNINIHTGNRHPGAGFFGPQQAPLPIGNAVDGLTHAKRAHNVTEAAFTRQLALRATLDQGFNEKFAKAGSSPNAYNQMFEDAVSLMRSNDLTAFDLSQESKATKALYGNSRFGQGALLARRLVQHGVRFVEVEYGGFDWHRDNFDQAERQLPVFDQVYAALLHDLAQQGLLERTLVVVATEFGRTPEINSNRGRDHHPQAYSYALAGGGVRGGQLIGATDRDGSKVVGQKTSPTDINATIGKALGLPHDLPVFSPSRRPFKMGGRSGQPIAQAFA